MRNNKQYIVPVVLLVLAIIAYFVFRKANDKSIYNWSKTYTDGNKEPYDFGVFKTLLIAKSKNSFIQIEKNLIKALDKIEITDTATYVFIGKDCYLNREELDNLMDFADEGHQVILISEGFPDTLYSALMLRSKPFNFDRFNDNKVTIESTNKNSKLKNYQFQFRFFNNQMDIDADWYHIDQSSQLSYYTEHIPDAYVPLSTINNKVNYARFKFGKGSIYIHTSPMLFTNYAIKDEQGFIYVNEVFNGIDLNTIIYDVGSREFKEDSDPIIRQSDSPLSYILKQESFKWAWYLFLLAALLFFLFRAKRKQRIIPVLETKKNTTINFIETITGLFYTNANHKKMADTKMHLFTYFVRHKLGINNLEYNSELVRRISLRTDVPAREIERIFEYYNQVINTERGQVGAENLMELHNRISKFYQLYKAKNK